MSETLQNRFNQAVESCEASLESMQEIVQMQQWDRLTDAEHGFDSSIAQLQQLVESDEAKAQALENYAERIQQLSITQRRVMRLISSNMRRVSEDIDGIDQGRKKLRQVSEAFSES
ncbi:MAG: hypothetical protein ABUK11_03700 [Mariprofundaceae bacterium]